MSRYFDRGSTRQYLAHVPMEAFEADKRMHAGFINGSRDLLKAIQNGRGPNRFLWSKADGGLNWQPTEATGKWAYRVDMCQQKLEAADRLRVSRDPCPVCATRQDIGCQHRRVA